VINVIYLPGIGDHRPWLQDKIIKLWRLFGIRAEFQAVGWASDEAFEDKLQKIIKRIDDLSADGQRLALVGVSAGASAALNAYMARPEKIEAVIFIAGKLFGTDIQIHYFSENPAFEASLFMSDAAVQRLTDADRHKMLYVYTSRDRTVWPSVNHIFGVRQKKVFAFSHISAIYLTILFHGRLIARFIKQRSKISD
jgi:predicted peptidase